MADEQPFIVPEDDDPYRTAKDIFSGTIGGIAQVLVGQPFDTTKVRLQSAPPGTYSSTLDVIRKLLSEEGPLAFYKGTLTPLLGMGVCISVQFATNEYMKRLFNKENHGGPLTYPQFFLSGAAAGMANSLVASPIEHIRIRLQTQRTGVKQFSGPLDCIEKLWNQGGARLIYRGLGPTLIREGVGGGIYFLTFEALVQREMHRDNIPRNEVESWKMCLFGGLAGYALWSSVYPVDVIKSNMQTDNYKKPKYANSFQAAKSVYATYGPRGFMKGFLPTILRAAPANAVTFLMFEQTMRLLQ